jgi:hypothetical protein
LLVRAEGTFTEQKIGKIAALNRPGLRIVAIRTGGELIRSGIAEYQLKKGDSLVVLANTSELLTLNERKTLRVGLRRGLDRGEGWWLSKRSWRRRNRPSANALPTSRWVGASACASSAPTATATYRDRIWRTSGCVRPTSCCWKARRPVSMRWPRRPNWFRSRVRRGGPTARTRRRLPSWRSRPWCMLAATNVMDIGILAMIAVAGILVLRCIDSEEAWGSIEASILILIFAMLIIGVGLQNTGAVAVIVEWASPWMTGLHPFLMLLAIYLLTSILTETVTNNAVAVLMAPIASRSRLQLADRSETFVVAVMFGASASFATPIGYQTNTLVYGAGNYRFTDFIKVGIPMNLAVGLASCTAIYIYYGM